MADRSTRRAATRDQSPRPLGGSSEPRPTSDETVISDPHDVEIDESRLGERPPGISEAQWRAKLVYEAHQAERAAGAEPITETSTTARDAADAVLRGA